MKNRLSGWQVVVVIGVTIFAWFSLFGLIAAVATADDPNDASVVKNQLPTSPNRTRQNPNRTARRYPLPIQPTRPMATNRRTRPNPRTHARA